MGKYGGQPPLFPDDTGADPGTKPSQTNTMANAIALGKIYGDESGFWHPEVRQWGTGDLPSSKVPSLGDNRAPKISKPGASGKAGLYGV
jgi:hypothetical protein